MTIYRPDHDLPLFPPNGKHPHHEMHNNSRAAWREHDATGRAAEVCRVLRKAGKPLTDREICGLLGSSDMNYARPAVTNLIDAGMLEEVYHSPCATTGRTVRSVWFTSKETP